MSRKERSVSAPKSKNSSGSSTHECPLRRDGKRCGPLNHVAIGDPDGKLVQAYSACSCGRRYEVPFSEKRKLVSFLPSAPRIRQSSTGLGASALDMQLASSVWPASHVSRFAKQGIVPIGTPVLHSRTQPVPVITKGLVRFGLHMISAMLDANGIGLAANQVGLPLQVIVHKMNRIAPQVLINPEILIATGTWAYIEGCLSLKIDDTSALVRRPKKIVVCAATIDGRSVVMHADELFSRVLQHEIDHLQGIEYVQRLEGEGKDNVYRIIENKGIDVSCIPPRPYEVALPRTRAGRPRVVSTDGLRSESRLESQSSSATGS